MLRTREICLSRNRAQSWGGVTRSNRHSACWPLLTTSETLKSFHLEKNSVNSLFWKTLPISLMRSRLCGHTFKVAECYQDFSGIPGEGDTSVVGSQWSVVGTEAAIHKQLTVGKRSRRRGRTAGSSPLGCARGRNDTPYGDTAGFLPPRRAPNDACPHKFQLWAPSRFFCGLAQTQACTLESNPLQPGSIRGSHSRVPVGLQICSKDLHV